MNKTISIQIPKPCHENWNAMTPAEQGRFCGSCQKIVVDFTRMNDHDIVSFFQDISTHGNTCGRFSSEQLNKPLLPKPQTPGPWLLYQWLTPFRKIAAMMITGLSLLLTACTDNRSSKGKVLTTETHVDSATLDSAYISGQTLPKDSLPVMHHRDKTLGEPAIKTEEPLQGDVILEPEPEHHTLGGACIKLPEEPQPLIGDTIIMRGKPVAR